MSLPSSESFQTVAPRLMWWCLLGASAIAAVAFLFAVWRRLPYPHELEWMEGALVDHASRVAAGLPVYCPPGPEHVPFLYAPLLFWLGGLGIAIGIDGLLALRLIAIGFSVGSALLIGHWVRRETGRRTPGLVATGVFFAGYGWLAWWYDLARNDGLFVFWMLAAGYQLRHGGGRRWLWAALLATAALLAKQSALMWLPALVVGALIEDWRCAARFAGACVGGIGLAVGLMHWQSDGWSTFYLFEMPQHHGWVGDRKLGYWTQDVVPMLPLLVLGVTGFVVECRFGKARRALALAAFGCGGLLTSWLSRMHVGGFDNVMMYGFSGACVLGPIAAAADGRRWLRVFGPSVMILQFAWLAHAAWSRSPTVTLLPSVAHRQAHDELRKFVEAQTGPVWIPAHGGISYRAGKGTGAHGQAIFDLLQMLPKLPDGMLDLDAIHEPSRLAHLSARGREAIATLFSTTHTSLQRRHFAAIVVDEVGAGIFPALFAAGFSDTVGKPTYERRPAPLLPQPTAIRPLLGYEVHSPYVLLPR